MKKVVLFLLLALFAAFPAFAGMNTMPTDSTGYGSALTSSGIAAKTNVAITQMLVSTDGTHNVTVAVYDAQTNSGDEVTSWTCPAASGVCAQDWPIPRSCPNGIYVAITTSGTANVWVEWTPRQ